MGTQESLSLPGRLKLTHPSLSHSGSLVRLLCPVILILLSTVDRLGYQFPVRYTIASQFVSHDLLGLAAVTA